MRGFNRDQISFTPNLANFGSGAYSAADQLGGVNDLDEVAADSGGVLVLESVLVIDNAKQKAALDIFFFDSQPTVSNADNGAFALSAANLSKCVGVAKVAAADYGDTSAQAVAQTSPKIIMKVAKKAKKLFAVVVSRGTPTYTAADNLVIKLGFEKP